MSPSSEKPSSPDPLAALDDDLGDDWESAFQAEDFMFSPEDEPSDFFLFDENAPEQNEDIASLFADQEEVKDDQAATDTGKAAPATDEESAAVLEFPNRIQILVASLLQLFQSRPRSQRLLIGSLPVALIVIIAATLLFQSDNDGPPPLHEPLPINSGQPSTLVSQAQQEATVVPPKQQTPATAQKPEPAAKIETVQHKWQLPTFVIVASDDNKAGLIVNIDLTLIANLEKGKSLPDDKQIFAKDIIYQFYRNRPAYELKRFSLARGEMISQLNAWLNKQWQNNPFDTIVFSRYQVTQTPPSLAPKVTFM